MWTDGLAQSATLIVTYSRSLRWHHMNSGVVSAEEDAIVGTTLCAVHGCRRELRESSLVQV